MAGGALLALGALLSGGRLLAGVFDGGTLLTGKRLLGGGVPALDGALAAGRSFLALPLSPGKFLPGRSLSFLVPSPVLGRLFTAGELLVEAGLLFTGNRLFGGVLLELFAGWPLFGVPFEGTPLLGGAPAFTGNRLLGGAPAAGAFGAGRSRSFPRSILGWRNPPSPLSAGGAPAMRTFGRAAGAEAGWICRTSDTERALPPLARIASCCRTKGTGAGGGAIFATTGRVSITTGGLTRASPAAPKTARRSGATAGATTLT